MGILHIFSKPIKNLTFRVLLASAFLSYYMYIYN